MNWFLTYTNLNWTLLKPLIIENMRDALPGLSVPILVELGTGDNWLQAH